MFKRTKGGDTVDHEKRKSFGSEIFAMLSTTTSDSWNSVPTSPTSPPETLSYSRRHSRQRPQSAKERLSVHIAPRTFGVSLITMLLQELREKEEIVELRINPSQKPTATQWWRRNSAPKIDCSSAYLSVEAADIASVQWSEANSLPIVLEKCLAEVERRGLIETGIYRLSGSSSAIQDLKRAFDTDPHAVDLSAQEFADINIVTGLIKLWFRELPEPLLTFELFNEFISATDVQEYDDRLIAVKTLVHQLPRPNFYCLKRILNHLDLISDHAETNQMYAQNLAIVFGPTLLKPPRQEDLSGSEFFSSEAASSIQHLGKCTTLVMEMLLQYRWLFDLDIAVAEGLTDSAVTEEPEPKAEPEHQDAAYDDALFETSVQSILFNIPHTSLVTSPNRESSTFQFLESAQDHSSVYG